MEKRLYITSSDDIDNAIESLATLDLIQQVASINSGSMSVSDISDFSDSIGKLVRTVNNIIGRPLTPVKGNIQKGAEIKAAHKTLDRFLDALTCEYQYNSQLGKSVVTAEDIHQKFRLLRDNLIAPETIESDDIDSDEDEFMDGNGS
jgi:hypothetical protein